MIIHYEVGRAIAHERQTEMLQAARAIRQVHGSAGLPHRHRAIVPVPLGHVRGLLRSFFWPARQKPA